MFAAFLFSSASYFTSANEKSETLNLREFQIRRR